MTKSLRRLMGGALALGAIAACDGSTDPVATATVEVTAYVDVDNSNSYDNTVDDPIQGATVTLTAVGDDANTLTATTGAGGVATFAAVEVGSYTASIQLPGSVTGVALASATSPSVTVSEDGAAEAQFRYTYNPGSITGHVFIGSGEFASGDVVIPGVTVTATRAGEQVASAETDGTGAFELTGLLPGEITVEVDAPAFLTGASNTATVTVVGGEESVADFGFQAEATHTVAEARAAAEGEAVAVRGIALTATVEGEPGYLSGSSFYLEGQGGISIFLGDVAATIEMGDEVLVYGERGAFNDEVQLSALAVLELGAGTLPDPTPVTASEIEAGEAQGQLAILDDVYVDSIGGPNVFVSDLDTGVETVVYLDSDAGIDAAATFEAGRVYDVTGVVARYRSTFEIKPRMPSDVTEETEVATTIAEVRAGEEDVAFTVTGVVTEAGSLEGNGFYLEDATGGIFVYTGSSNLPAVEVGDVVTVTGVRGQYYDVVQISGAVTVEATGETATPRPREITAEQLNTGDYQGRLVQLTEVVLDSIAGSTLYFSDGQGGATAVVYLDSDSGVPAAGFTVGDTYTVAGVVSNFRGTEQVKPRSMDDVEGVDEVGGVTTVAEARAAAEGTPVELTGVVTVTNGADPMLQDRNAYLQDATGGILIRMPSADSVVTVGDSVTVTGTTGSFAQELQVNVDGLTRHGTGTVPAPRVVTPTEINAGQYQGELAVLEGVEVTAIDGGEVTVTDGTEEVVVYVDTDTEIDVAATFSVGSSYDVTGVLSRYNELFELKPRQASDIVAQ